MATLSIAFAATSGFKAIPWPPPDGGLSTVRCLLTEKSRMSTVSNCQISLFLALPIIGIQLIGAAYFQAIGKALPALLLTLSRQGLFFIPLLFILPSYFGVIGVWIAFPLADLFSTIITVYFLNRAIRKELILKH